MSYATTNPPSGTQDLRHGDSAPHSHSTSHSHEHTHGNVGSVPISGFALGAPIGEYSSSGVGSGVGIGSAAGVGAGAGVIGGTSSSTYTHTHDHSHADGHSHDHSHGHSHSHGTEGVTYGNTGGNRQDTDPARKENVGREAEKIKNNITPTDATRQNDKTYAGFDPKVNTHNDNLEPAVAKPKQVEHISTDGPHGLVWQESTGKYVHRRELEGKNSI
ncbi:hypothetical protein [Phaffia rhodozyma]|uniref:Uncharacterized protein n=1 Tax=Phaffia rhodozyma TaxID=264483 RepID=A0A0F7SQ90_PHARH|nr:hypothetical protein [Phaffia rhodozyma]